MIVRILGEGQFDVPEGALDGLNELDDKLVAAIDSGDEQSFSDGLSRLLDAVANEGQRMPDDYLGPSELVLPGPDSTVEQVRELLTEEGLLPG